jgi:hypothetical protein
MLASNFGHSEKPLELVIAECKDSGGEITDDDVRKLTKVAQALEESPCEMWCNLDSDERSDDYDPDDQWAYRGGVMMLTFRGGFTDGWVDLTYNEALTDIFYGYRWAHQKYNWCAVEAEMKKDSDAKEAEHKALFEAEEAKRKAELARLEATPGTPENVVAFLNKE